MPGEQDSRVGLIWVALLYSITWGVLADLLFTKRHGCK